MESMTGFGKGSQLHDNYVITVLAKSVNNKGLSIHFRLPPASVHFEEKLYRMGRKLFSRGRIDVSVFVDSGSGEAELEPDVSLAKAYLTGAERLAKMFSIAYTPDAFGLITLSGMMKAPDPSEEDGFEKNLLLAVEEAFQTLLLSRREEGKGLEAVFSGGLKKIDELSVPVARSHSRRVAHLFDNRKERIAELLGDASVDENRLAQEMALLSDRLDITEEHQRLASHIRTALEILPSGNSGRKLGFVLQEMHRELNTMGAKVDSVEDIHTVIEMKDILGGLREQVANVQ